MAVNMEAFRDVQLVSLGTHTSRKQLKPAVKLDDRR